MAFTPYAEPIPRPPKAIERLDVAVRLSTQKGWLEINHGPYTIHKDSFSSQQRQQRRQTASSAYVSGTYTVNSVPDNITEQVYVWVAGDTHYEMEAAEATLVDAFEQVYFEIERRIEDSVRLWHCFAADIQVQVQHEHRHARRALVMASVPRLPTEERSLG